MLYGLADKPWLCARGSAKRVTWLGLATSQQPYEGDASIARKPGQSGRNTGLRTCTAGAVDPDGEIVSPKPHGEMGSRLLSRLHQTRSGSLFSGVLLT